MEVERRMLLGGFFAACIVVVFSLDFLNGSSRLANHREKIAITQFNLGGSVLNLSVILLADLVSVTPKPVSISKSVTHQTFAYDSTGNQIMILIESWGLPSKNQKLKMIQNSIKEAALQQGWNAEFGSTGFEGSTTNAEMRELLSARGNFRYLLNKDSASRLESIFTIKKKQGFTTIAAHSFSGKMFWRIGWWRNIGIDSAFFLEDIVKRNKLNTNSLNYETPFASVNDEDVYLFVAGIPAAESRKKFVYFLSENSHLPYREQPRANKGLFRSTPLSFPGELSVEADNQLKRIQGLIFYILESPQSKQWSKVLIMGDHMPPFTNNTDRQFYSSTEVPYFILYR